MYLKMLSKMGMCRECFHFKYICIDKIPFCEIFVIVLIGNHKLINCNKDVPVNVDVNYLGEFM